MNDEEKDINLLLSWVWWDPQNFKDRILDKMNKFTE